MEASGKRTFSFWKAVGAAAFLLALFAVGWSPGSAWASPEKPNIVIIVVDAMRPDHLGCYGYRRPTSPNIDSLARVSIRMETAITQAPWTKGAFSSILTSRYPFQHGVTDWVSVLPESMLTLPEMLSKEGYSTMGIFNMIGLGGRFGVLQGFAETVEPEDGDLNARETTDLAIEMIEATARPFFLIVHYFDSHEPYRPPIQFLDEVRLESDPDPMDGRRRGGKSGSHPPTDEDILRTQLLYDGCIRFVDHHIGRLVETLRQKGIDRNTLLVITADHGEAFYEHGVASHGANTYDEAIKVPLIVHYPDRFEGPVVVGAQVAHVDILPTITEIVGMDDDFHREGTSLVTLLSSGEKPRSRGKFLPSYATLCECTVRRAPGTKCIRTNDWKLIVEPTTSLVELYNLKEDPGEKLNLWGLDIPEGKTYLDRMKEIPGVELHGWRLACTADGSGVKFEADLSLPEGGRFVDIERFTRRQTLSVELTDDSTSLHLKAEPEDLDFILFDVSPPDAPVRFSVTADGENAPLSAKIGTSDEMLIAEGFDLTPTEAAGLPQDFELSRRKRRPGMHIWWLSGETIGQAGGTVELTPEEIKRLKALGYLQ